MEKIRILFLAASPGDDEDLDLIRNLSQIQQAVRSARERHRIELRQEWGVTVSTLMQAMLEDQPTIVHFAGHGSREGIVLEDEMGRGRLISGDALARLFGFFSDALHCVVLSSCHSESQARAVRARIPFVVAMKGLIPDHAAIAFSAGFYQAIGARREIPEAFQFGVERIRLEGAFGAHVPVLL